MSTYKKYKYQVDNDRKTRARHAMACNSVNLGSGNNTGKPTGAWTPVPARMERNCL
jgi:hypothetical protein